MLFDSSRVPDQLYDLYFLNKKQSTWFFLSFEFEKRTKLMRKQTILPWKKSQSTLRNKTALLKSEDGGGVGRGWGGKSQTE